MSTRRSERTPDGSTEPEVAELRTRIAVLEEENARLRDERARARRATHRRTAVGLLALGLIGLGAGIVFPDTRTVLFALGGTGVFGGFLTYVLTPERFVSVRIGEQVFETLRRDREAMMNELGLRGDPVYLPGETPTLFVPRYASRELPDRSALEDLFVVPEDARRGGVAFAPIGAGLFEQLRETRTEPLEADPYLVARTLADATVELLELADGVDHDTDVETERVTFEIDGIRFGDPAAIDHPVVSFLAVGLAVSLDRTVHVTVSDTDPAVVTCRLS